MKRIIVIIAFLFLVLFSFSQNKVITRNGIIIKGNIESFTNKTLNFSENIDSLNSRSLNIDEVKEIYGPMPEIRKNAILKKNPKIKIVLDYKDPDYKERIVEQDSKINIPFNQSIQKSNSFNGGNRDNISFSDPMAMEILHTRMCLMNYRREKLTGIWLTIGGGVIAGASSALYQNGDLNVNSAEIGYLSGGLIMLTGEIMQLTCNKWLKRAYIGPVGSGIGIKYKF
jgi:hypothetical protein